MIQAVSQSIQCSLVLISRVLNDLEGLVPRNQSPWGLNPTSLLSFHYYYWCMEPESYSFLRYVLFGVWSLNPILWHMGPIPFLRLVLISFLSCKTLLSLSF